MQERLGEALRAPEGDFFLHGMTILPQPGQVMHDGALLLRGGRITAIGPTAQVRAQVTASAAGGSRIIALDAKGYTAIPGLINAHTHAAMGFFRGLAFEQPTMIESFFFPAEKALTPELLEPLAYSYLYAGLVSGTTTFGDHYYHIGGVARAIERLGLRGVVGETVADLGGAFPGRQGWETWRRVIEAWPYTDRLRPAVAPHATDTVSPTLLRELADYATRAQLPLHMHLAQSAGEHQRVTARAGCSPVVYAAQCGALSERTLAVHLVRVDAADIALLKSSGVTAALCPASQILYEQLAPLAELLAAGIPVALATDCAASNDTADLLAEMRLMALLARDRGASSTTRDPAALLAMTTTNPAKALGLAEICGSLTVGKVADVVLLADDLSSAPAPRPEVNLIFSASSRQVQHVLVDGRFVLYRGAPTRLSESDMSEAYKAAVEILHKRLKKT